MHVSRLLITAVIATAAFAGSCGGQDKPQAQREARSAELRAAWATMREAKANYMRGLMLLRRGAVSDLDFRILKLMLVRSSMEYYSLKAASEQTPSPTGKEK